METVKQLWGGELPEFDSMDAVNELLNTLVAGPLESPDGAPKQP